MATPCDQVQEVFLKEIAPAMEQLVKEFSWPTLFSMVEDAIKAVEAMEGLDSGPEKKACAIDCVLAVYDQYQVDIPFLPAMFEKAAHSTLPSVTHKAEFSSSLVNWYCTLPGWDCSLSSNPFRSMYAFGSR